MNDRNIDVSIIIVNYNGTDMLDECIASINTFTKDVLYEIIVIDNASVDGIDRLRPKYPDVMFIVNDGNRGFAHANNQGFEKARGTYTLILNNDTVFIEDTLSKVFAYVCAGKDDLFVACRLLNRDRSVQISSTMFPTIANTVGANFFLYKSFPHNKTVNKLYQYTRQIEEPVEADVLFGAFIFCNTETLKNMGGFDERFFFYGEDIDLCKRHLLAGGKNIYLPNTQIIHYGGATTEKMLWFKYRNEGIAYIQIFQKYFHGGKFAIVFSVYIMGLVLRAIAFFFMGLTTWNKKHFLRSYYNFKQIFLYPKNRFK